MVFINLESSNTLRGFKPDRPRAPHLIAQVISPHRPSSILKSHTSGHCLSHTNRLPPRLPGSRFLQAPREDV